MSTITDDARHLAELKAEKKGVSAREKELTREIQKAEYSLKLRMEEEGHEGIKTNGKNFVPAETTYGQVQDRSAFVEWALENAPELVEHREMKERINELVRQRLDDGEEFPPGLSFYVKEYVSVRAA